MMSVSQERNWFIQILVISVILLVLGLLLFGLTIGLDPFDYDHAARMTLYTIYMLGFPLLVTSIVGIIAGVTKRKALVFAFRYMSMIICVGIVMMAFFVLIIKSMECEENSKREPRIGMCFEQKIMSIYIVMAIDVVLVFICCVIGLRLTRHSTCPCCSPRTRDEPELITLPPISTRPSHHQFSSSI